MICIKRPANQEETPDWQVGFQDAGVYLQKVVCLTIRFKVVDLRAYRCHRH